MVYPLMSKVSPALAPIFAMYISFVGLAMLNVVASLLVKSALTTSSAKTPDMLAYMMDIFLGEEADPEMMITRRELEEKLASHRMQKRLKDVDLDASEVRSIFILLDKQQGSQGAVLGTSLVNECFRMRGDSRAVELHLLSQMFRKHVKYMEGQLASIRKGVSTLKSRSRQPANFISHST
eukprot:gnl/TRDRNA2_/TRDRNA2_89345_c1_seq1.p1 gnl/TRDRNA2_/TRDRNA2_89345_c1~~gnl/TRDRNA2_/TRDRNA2_89345_c1_seq1.p1  ORF type:complete len:199 (+),score=37.51 gnl/TRDRNA2_/TRDRNA2_89345_c1_seq1:59-598(+)